MAWTDNELSTLQSIAKYEAEINNLAGTYTRKALTTAEINAMTAEPDSITAIVAIKSTGAAIDLDYSADAWQLPAGTYTRFICQGDDDYFSLLEGSGKVLTSANGDFVLTLEDDPTWTDVVLQSDWQPKIDLAKQIIYDTIYTNLTQKNIPLDEIETAIDGIENPQVLNLPSDFKTLELIFMDLYGKIGTAETIAAKLNWYRKQYKESFERAFAALDFGDYGYIFTTQMGRISR